MTKEEKELLLKDLCARLPYGVKITCFKNGELTPYLVDFRDSTIHTTSNFNGTYIKVQLEDCKPYLRPMSSMTEEELKEFYMVEGMDTNPVILNKPQYDWHFTTNGIDYLLFRHFDFRGLIPMGLALEALEDMYN